MLIRIFSSDLCNNYKYATMDGGVNLRRWSVGGNHWRNKTKSRIINCNLKSNFFCRPDKWHFIRLALFYYLIAFLTIKSGLTVIISGQSLSTSCAKNYTPSLHKAELCFYPWSSCKLRQTLRPTTNTLSWTGVYDYSYLRSSKTFSTKELIDI